MILSSTLSSPPVPNPYTDESARKVAEGLEELKKRKAAQAQSDLEPSSRDFAQMVQDSVTQRLKLYAPILHPGAFIEEAIKQGIREYEAKTGTTTGLTPDSSISVDYEPLVAPNPNLRLEAPVKKTHRFTLTEVVTGSYQHQVMAWRRAFDNRYRVVGHQHQPLINHLTRNNLETRMMSALTAYKADSANKTGLMSLYKSDVMHRCLAYLSKADPTSKTYAAVADFLEGKVQAREVKFHGSTLNGAFLIPLKEGGILFSVDDNTHFEIGTATNHYHKFGARMSEQVPVYPTSKAFKQWVSSKLPVYEQYRYTDSPDAFALKKRSRSTMPWLGIGPTEGQVYANPFSFHATPSVDTLTERLYEGFMQRLKSDIDTLMFTDGEQSNLKSLEIAKTLLTIYSTAGAFATPGTGSKLFLLATSLLTSGAYAGASLAQSVISDRPRQADEFLKEAIVSAALAGAFLAAPLTGRFASAIRYPFKSIPQALSYYRFVSGHAQKRAPRIINQLLGKTIKPRPAAGASGAKQMRRASVGDVVKASTPVSTALSTTEQSRRAIERSLPIARARLDAAIRTAADPKHVEDTRMLARLFYGSDAPETLERLQRKQQLMKADLGQLKMDNIEFLPGEGTGWSAQLQPSNYADYKAGATTEKYIEVNVDGALEYYRDMGSSDDTLANTLIHEMGHGMPMDEDFVYAGKLRGAREDIVDLLNLGKSTEPTNFRYLSGDAADGTVSLFAREPQLHNADSTLFVTALLDQAMNNRSLFDANMAAINEAVARAGGNLIKETVPVRIITKRSAHSRPAPSVVWARHDQTGRILGVFARVPKPGTQSTTLLDEVRKVFKWH